MLVCVFCLITLHARPRVQRAPGFPCALLFPGGENRSQNSGMSRRENEKPCLLFENLIFNPSSLRTQELIRSGTSVRRRGKTYSYTTNARDYGSLRSRLCEKSEFLIVGHSGAVRGHKTLLKLGGAEAVAAGAVCCGGSWTG